MNHHQALPEGEDWSRPKAPLAAAGDSLGPIGQASAPPLAGIGELADALGRHWLSLGLWVLFCLAAGGIYLHRTPAEFVAAATIILEPRRQTPALQDGGSVGYPPTLDSAQTESQTQVIKSERIMAPVFDLLDLKDAPEFAQHGPGFKDRILEAFGLTSPLPAEPEALRAQAFQAFSDRVGVRRIGQSYVLEVSYRALSPEQAARIANAVTSQYILSQIDRKAAAVQRGTEYLQGRIVDIQAEHDAALVGVREGRIPDVQFPDSDAQVIGAALPPLGKASPQTGLVLAFSVVFGLMTGFLAVALRHGLDRSLKTRQQVWRLLRIECLGVIPNAARMRDTRLSRRKSALGRAVMLDTDSQFAHAIRAARTAILLSAPAGRHRAIGIVSWSHGEGRSTFASNLAHLMSVSGEAVELVDGDLHNPSLTKALAPKASSGLNEALNGGALPLSIPLSSTLGFIAAVGIGREAQLNTYFGSAEMQSLMSSLRSRRDVIIDLPPLSDSSDARALSPTLDGLVLVVRAGVTKIEEAAEAMMILQAANARVLGVVLNMTQPRRRKVRNIFLRRAPKLEFRFAPDLPPSDLPRRTPSKNTNAIR